MKASHVEKYQATMARELLSPALSEARWLQAQMILPEVGPEEKNTIADERLAIYRNNVMHSLTGAMADQYPIVKRVVGDNFFLALSRDYIRANPPEKPALTFIGESFADYIRNNDHCRPLPYLAGLARLEWLCQNALHAADDPVLTPRDLSAVDPEKLAGATFHLHASATLLNSPFPVGLIWEENLKDEPGEIDLAAAEPSRLLIYRKGFNVSVVNLQPPLFDLLTRLQQGIKIGGAWEAVSAQHDISDDEFPAILAWLLGLEVFSRFDLAE